MDEAETVRFLALLAERSRDPDLLESTVRAARRKSPMVAALPAEETRRHARALIEGVRTALLSTGGEPGEDVLAVAEQFGSDRARQGLPVEAWLNGFQAGRSHLVRMLIEIGRDMGVPPEVLLDGLTRIDEITNTLVHRMVHAHRVTELEMARTARESRVQALRQLLHGERPASLPAPLEAGAAYHCVVSDVSDPAVAQRLEAALTARGPALCGLVDGRLAALLARLPDMPDDVPLLVAAPPASPSDVSAFYELGRRALRAGQGAGLTGLRKLTDLALLTATEAEPRLGRMLADGLLNGLDPADQFHRELAETALAYLDHGARIEPAAVALHVHGNTVKYRLRRLHELTGRSLSDAPDGAAVANAAHWWWALRSWLAAAGTSDPDDDMARSLPET
jgi:hypothetical protein